jgi:type VI secretion system protein ImpE
VDGQPFEWIADADSRLGPVLEAFVNGRYYWIPFSRLSRISLDLPTDLRDMVWLPAQLHFDNGGETVALIPTRYPGSQSSTDGAIQLARKTEWQDQGADRFFGLGQRVLSTDAGDLDLLSVRLIELQTAPATEEGA